MQASRVTFPSRSGSPPIPTDWPSSFASSILQPCSTASREFPLVDKISHAFLVAFFTSHVATTTGLFICFTELEKVLLMLSPIPSEATPDLFIKLLLFIL